MGVETGWSAQIRVLIVGDGDGRDQQLSTNFESHGWAVAIVTTLEEALEYLTKQQPDLVVIELHLQSKPASFVLTELLRAHPGLAIVMTSRFITLDDVTSAMRMGAKSVERAPLQISRAAAVLGRSQTTTSTPLIRRAREHIKRAGLIAFSEVYVACGKNVSKTARELGVNRRTVQRRLERLAESGEVF